MSAAVHAVLSMTTTAFDASEKREVKENDDTPRCSDLDGVTDGLSGVMVTSAEGATAVALDELGSSWTATLRGVPAYRLMSWMDNPFNRGHNTDRSLRRRYSNSVSVSRLDFFVSHSWNASWWEKLLALCYLFNYQRASWSSIAAAIIEVSVVLYIYCNQSAPDTSLPTAHFLACISTSVFILLLLLPNFQLTRSSYKLFVDNCCIPQDDPVLKEVGIRSLGSYLSRSSSIIVMWSKCYFDRLWCVYELAAFLSLKAGALNGDRGPAERGSPVVEELSRVGRGIKEWMVGSSYRDQVVFTSLPLIKFVFAFTLVGFVGNILLSIEVAVVGSFKASLRARLICAIPEGLLLAAVLCPFASRYVRDRDALVDQIMTFQMENTKCTVEADREFVTGRISAMYNGDLTTFERVVKSEVGRAARQTLGIRRGTIPFKYVVLLSTVHINLALCLLPPDIIIWGPFWSVGCFLPQVLLAFTRMPLYIFIILTGARTAESSPTRTRRALFFLFVGCWSIFKVSLELVSEGHPYTLIPFCLIHSIICIALYFPVFPRESRGCLSRFIDLIFPVDVDVEDLNSSSVRVKVAGVADLGGGSKSLPSLRRVQLGAVSKVYHARSW